VKPESFGIFRGRKLCWIRSAVRRIGYRRRDRRTAAWLRGRRFFLAPLRFLFLAFAFFRHITGSIPRPVPAHHVGGGSRWALALGAGRRRLRGHTRTLGRLFARGRLTRAGFAPLLIFGRQLPA